MDVAQQAQPHCHSTVTGWGYKVTTRTSRLSWTSKWPCGLFIAWSRNTPTAVVPKSTECYQDINLILCTSTVRRHGKRNERLRFSFDIHLPTSPDACQTDFQSVHFLSRHEQIPGKAMNNRGCCVCMSRGRMLISVAHELIKSLLPVFVLVMEIIYFVFPRTSRTHRGV